MQEAWSKGEGKGQTINHDHAALIDVLIMSNEEESEEAWGKGQTMQR